MTPLDQIRQAFSDYFSGKVQLPDPLPERGELLQAGWSISYVRLTDEQGQPCVEFLANHRFTNAQHIRILSSGQVVPLAAWQDDVIFDPNVPGDREAAEARLQAHNDAVTADLKSKGLIS